MPGAVIRQFACPRPDGYDKIRRLLQQLEPLRQHTNNGIGLPIERNGLAKNTLGATEPALPQSVTEQGNCRRCRLVVHCTDWPAGNRIHPEHMQQVSGHHLPGNLLRLAVSGQRHRHDPRSSEIFKRRALRLPILVVQPRGGEHGKVRCVLRDDHEAIGIRIGNGRSSTL